LKFDPCGGFGTEEDWTLLSAALIIYSCDLPRFVQAEDVINQQRRLEACVPLGEYNG
jgi:hypothetical protein